MASVFGRSIIVPLTNKSGGSVVLGDVVVVDTTTDESFTTTTSAANTSAIGVAAETIASNAVGRVIVGGYASLVNVNASVTRNQFGTTHTVAKQAVASASRVAGTFCRWLKTSATPSAYIYPVDLAGAALTDPTTTRGDYITRGASALQRVALGAAGTFVGSDGTDTLNRSLLGATSFAGYNTVGGSFISMNGSYAKKITLAATSLVLNIGCHVKGNGTNAQGLSCAIMSDTAGTPTNLIARNAPGYDATNAVVIFNNHMNTTARWIEMPINAYLTAGDYWICVIGGNGGTGLQLAKDGSGSDKTSNFYPSDNSAVAFSAGTNNHSIRALILA